MSQNILSYVKFLTKPIKTKHEIFHFKLTRAITQTQTNRFIDQLRKFKQERPKVLMLSVNTAFGSITQAQIIAEALQQTSQHLDAPLYTFVEDLALGPGYYLASCGAKVHANPFSLVGNLSVNYTQLGFQKIQQKYQLNRMMVGPQSLLLDAFQEVSEKQSKFIDQELNMELETMINHIKTNRQVGLLNKNVDDILTAQIYNATEALENGLIDEINTFEQFTSTLYPKHKVREISIGKGSDQQFIINGGQQQQQMVQLFEQIMSKLEYQSSDLVRMDLMETMSKYLQDAKYNELMQEYICDVKNNMLMQSMSDYQQQ